MDVNKLNLDIVTIKSDLRNIRANMEETKSSLKEVVGTVNDISLTLRDLTNRVKVLEIKDIKMEAEVDALKALRMKWLGAIATITFLGSSVGAVLTKLLGSLFSTGVLK